jgi:hypothetical protein
MMPKRSKISGYRSGSNTISFSALISAHFTTITLVVSSGARPSDDDDCGVVDGGRTVFQSAHRVPIDAGINDRNRIDVG